MEGQQRHFASSGTGKEAQVAFRQNADAVRQVAAAVEGTLGPKGLDVMLVGDDQEVIVTNDGVTILDKMEHQHPAARMIVNIARAQQNEVGDGTTTATVLAAALVEEGAKQVARGVPVAKVITGIRRGVRFALKRMQEKAHPIWELDDEWLLRIAYTAGREQEDIAELVLEAAALVGREKLIAKGFKLADAVIAHPRAENAVFSGLSLPGVRLHPQMPVNREGVRVLVLGDDLVPDMVNDSYAGTDAGMKKQEQLDENFREMLQKIIEAEIGLVAVEGEVHPLAEGLLTEAEVMAVAGVSREDLLRIAQHTGARILKRSALQRSSDELESLLGFCEEALDVENMGHIRIGGGAGKPSATILVGAATEEVVSERERICKDAASSVQAALRGGFLAGGGATELALARDVEKFRDSVQGMERFGVSAVAEALQRPMAQVVANAGFNPLEKVEEVKALQWKRQSHTLGVDCDRGAVTDMVEMGVVDPLPVKYHALKAAGEVSTAILRIHTVVKMKDSLRIHQK
ncbi:thermosome-like protein [Marinithermofilum abyssi]|uniref:Thermosome-like protein n=1 Tax=Marinithermofilum abyssi TaxID=1571185 RepID=A0A8J2VBV5_9BACL|nr:TCP-1/cpn60 chaperonin family protein [Marinithermofilum abyssi]GGE14517.1 thermosome-like protein [Marinithermofilum abyssi]